MGNFLEALNAQGRVIWALTMREIITRFGRNNIGFLWLLAEPIMFVVGVTALWTMESKTIVGNFSIAEFAVVSYSTVLLWRNPSARMVKAIEVNSSLLYHRAVRPFDIYLSRIFLEYISGSAGFLIIYIAFTAVGITHLPYDPLRMISGWLLIAWFSFAFSVITGAMSELSDVMEKVWHIVLYFMMPVSGSFFPLEIMPEGVRQLLLLFPLVDATEYFRSGYYGPNFPSYYNMPYTVVTILFLTLVGLSLISIASRRIEPE